VWGIHPQTALSQISLPESLGAAVPNRDRYGQHIYGSVHKAQRKRWMRKVRAGGVCCWRCGKPIGSTATWDLGHLDEDGLARGFPTRHPEHRSCNRATVTHLKQKLAAQAPLGGSREW
jgi:hypothetical protein